YNIILSPNPNVGSTSITLTHNIKTI
ncbi:hypothetical protein, partial [Plasmodium yoelii yoelii]